MTKPTKDIIQNLEVLHDTFEGDILLSALLDIYSRLSMNTDLMYQIGAAIKESGILVRAEDVDEAAHKAGGVLLGVNDLAKVTVEQIIGKLYQYTVAYTSKPDRIRFRIQLVEGREGFYRWEMIDD